VVPQKMPEWHNLFGFNIVFSRKPVFIMTSHYCGNIGYHEYISSLFMEHTGHEICGVVSYRGVVPFAASWYTSLKIMLLEKKISIYVFMEKRFAVFNFVSSN
jgi:hypothetical protein